MFSLIITIISIALVAALAVATIYYGGSAFTQGSAQANASALANAGQQVVGAATIFRNDTGGNNPLNMAELVSGGKYLQGEPAVPTGWGKMELGRVKDGSNYTLVAYSVGTSAESEVCKKVQKQVVGDEAIATQAIAETQTYGCFKAVQGNMTDTENSTIDSDDVDVFFFKLAPTVYN